MAPEKFHPIGVPAFRRVNWCRPCASATCLLTLVLLACAGLATGCRKPSGTVLGKAPKGQPRTILAVRSGDTPPQVTIGGVMVEKCPVAGCWFRLQDSTGTLKVDTKSAGFVVVDVPLQSQVTVTGRIVADGSDVMLEATGLRY
jgi:uncharacterized protein YdeI (BOF family)